MTVRMGESGWSAARRALNHPGLERAVDAYMTRAIGLAIEHRPHPNPRVGAVVVAPDGSVVGEAAHQAAGKPVITAKYDYRDPEGNLVYQVVRFSNKDFRARRKTSRAAS